MELRGGGWREPGSSDVSIHHNGVADVDGPYVTSDLDFGFYVGGSYQGAGGGAESDVRRPLSGAVIVRWADRSDRSSTERPHLGIAGPGG